MRNTRFAPRLLTPQLLLPLRPAGNEQHLHPPGHQPHHTRSGSGTGMSPAPFLVAAAAAAASGGAGSPLRSTDRSVTLALTVKNRLKGMRRRAAKTLTRMETAR